MKICKYCKTKKDESEFYTYTYKYNYKDKHVEKEKTTTGCKICTNNMSKQRYEKIKDLEDFKIKNRKHVDNFNSKHPTYQKDNRYKYFYGDKYLEKQKIASKKYYLKNKEKIKKESIDYSKKLSKEKKRGYRLKHKYGITLDNYNNLFIQQDNKCKICNGTFYESKALTPVIDHDHKTGKIRGLLCYRCNSGLGLYLENVSTLENAIKYIKENN